VVADRDGPAPQSECHKTDIQKDEAECRIAADQAAQEASRSEHLIQSGHTPLNGMRSLGENQRKKDEGGPAFHVSADYAWVSANRATALLDQNSRPSSATISVTRSISGRLLT